MAYAHSKNEQGEYHDLEAHLREVAEQCAAFSVSLHAQELGYYIGLWHDVGKYRAQWQQYLLAVESNPRLKGTGGDHKAAGAKIAREHQRGAALLIQGHHGGLRALMDLEAWLQSRAADIEEPITTARNELSDLLPTALLRLPSFLTATNRCSIEFFFRLLFSALVDSDFLSTERHGNLARSDLRATTVSLAELWERFEQAQNGRIATSEATPVNRLRREMYAACITAAAHPPGLFRLAIPTGGGKTLSGMGFALAHARHYGQRRVIVAIPFISITTQTAEVYRGLFESDSHTAPAVLEHHSAIEVDDSDEYDPAHQWQRLAAENWDAPIVVTTTVQLFESLFNNKVSRCRKLHRLANSVIILDEAQQLPPHLLKTILDGLQELCRHYNATVVLSTATQPAFETLEPFRTLQARDIIPDPTPYFRALERVDYDQSRLDTPQSWQSIADLMQQERQALAIVNVKRHASELLAALGDIPHRYHLSTSLCGAHRRTVLKTVRELLKAEQPCLLVSTQVIEAGVDVDFPMVLRALAPLDSMVQAAGRCNREGKLTVNGQLIKGRVILFQSEDGAIPQGQGYRMGRDTAETVLLFAGEDERPDDPALLYEYFARLYQGVDTDARQIQSCREALDYPLTAEKFRMIEERTIPVIVTSYGTEEEKENIQTWLTELRNRWGSPRLLLRKLQPYMVTLYLDKARELEKRRLWLPVSPELPDVGVWYGKYDPLFGLVEEDVSQDMLIL